MKRIDTIVKHLEMMGYEVVNNTQLHYIMVMLRTRSRYCCYYNVSYIDLEKDFIVETIVSSINGKIKEEL